MIKEIADTPAVFDPEAVSSLTGHPGDREFAVVFVARYRGLLPERVRRIQAGLATAQVAGDIDDAMDAVLSLKVSSTTVGANELAAAAAHLERLLRGGNLAQAAVLGARLPGVAERADRALGAFLAG